MRKIIKYILLSVVGGLLLLALLLFIKPSLVLNRAALVGSLNSAGVSKVLSYKEMDLSVLSHTFFDKELRFAAKDLCVKDTNLDLCLPNVSIDIIFTIGADGIRVKRIEQLVVEDGKLVLDVPAARRSEPSAAAKMVTMDDDSDPKIVKTTLFLRFLELFLDISMDDIQNFDIKNFLYTVSVKEKTFKGRMDIKKIANGISVGLNNEFKGERASLAGKFGKNISIDLSFNDRPVASADIYSSVFKEVLEYIKSKEIYQYKTKYLRAKIDIKNVGSAFGLLNLYLGPKFQASLFGGHIGCDVAIDTNGANLGEAFISFLVNGELVDAGRKITIKGTADYDLYQKVPYVHIDELVSSAPKNLPVSDYYYYKLLTELARWLDYHMEYHWKNGDLKVTITRDFSKFPKKTY